MVLENSAEAGVAGNNVLTTDTGSGDPWDVVTPGTGAPLTYSAAHPAPNGSLGIDVAEPATVVASYFGWSTSLGTLSTSQTLYVRFYYWHAATPSSSLRFLRIANGSTLLAALQNGSGTNQLQGRDSADATASTVTAALTVSTVLRIEAKFTGLGGGAGAGAVEQRWYVGDSTTISDSVITSALNLGSAAPNQVLFGATTANSSVSTTYSFDGWGVSDVDWLGPQVLGPVPGPAVDANYSRFPKYRLRRGP